MKSFSQIKFPVFVYEIETGDLELYFDRKDLLIIAEEFRDVLSDEFEFWDSDGYKILIEGIKDKELIVKRLENDYERLRHYIVRYIKKIKRDFFIEDAERNLVKIFTNNMGK